MRQRRSLRLCTMQSIQAHLDLLRTYHCRKTTQPAYLDGTGAKSAIVISQLEPGDKRRRLVHKIDTTMVSLLLYNEVPTTWTARDAVGKRRGDEPPDGGDGVGCVPLRPQRRRVSASLSLASCHRRRLRQHGRRPLFFDGYNAQNP